MPQDPREKISPAEKKMAAERSATPPPEAEGRRHNVGFIYSVNRHCVVFSSFGDVTSDKNAGFTRFRTT